LLLRLLVEDRFPRIWVPSPENRDLRQLIWHRHRLVQMRKRAMNQIQATAMNEGVRRKKTLWSKAGRRQLESLLLAPWATRRRQDLLEMVDRLNAAIEQEARKRPEVLRLMTHPGVGPITALTFVLAIGSPDRFACGKKIGSYLGLIPCESSAEGYHFHCPRPRSCASAQPRCQARLLVSSLGLPSRPASKPRSWSACSSSVFSWAPKGLSSSIGFVMALLPRCSCHSH
jgi:hypothetical protein